MESDPAATAFLDVFLEGLPSLRGPAIRRVVELDEELVLRKVGVVDGIGVLNVIDGKIVFARLFLQPHFCGFYEGKMYASGFRQSDDPEFWLMLLRRG